MLKKFLDYSIGNIFVLIVSLITTPIITNILSPNEYGKVSLFITFCNVVSLMVLAGMDQVYMRFYYEKSENKYNLLKHILNYIFKSFCIFLIIIFLFRNIISKFILGYESISVLLMIILNIITLVFMRIGFCSIRMQQKGKLYSYSQIVGKVIYILAIFIFYYIYKDNYKTLVFTMLSTNICITLFLMYVDRYNIRKSILYKCDYDYKFKDKIKFGLPFVFSAAFIWIFKSSDTIIIKAYNGHEEVGIYSIAFSLIGVVNIIQSTFMNFWTPIANEAFEKNPKNTDFFVRINDMVVYLMFIVCSSIVILKDCIHLILGQEYYQAVYLLPFLIFIPLMSVISETTVQGINFKKSSKYHTYISIICALINIILNIVLVKIFSLQGAAIATAISYFIYFYLRTKISINLYPVKFNLNKFYISTIFFLIFIIYSSYRSINLGGIVLYILLILLITKFYNREFEYLLRKIRNFRKDVTRFISR